MTMQLKARRPARPWWQKLNPVWLLAANDDDGWFGNAMWNPEGRRDAWTAVLWWARNPAHNLCWYGLGVADRDRVYTDSPWTGTGEPFALDGGLLRGTTAVTVFNRVRELPYRSYRAEWRGRRLEAYAGWRPSGAFGFALRVRRV